MYHSFIQTVAPTPRYHPNVVDQVTVTCERYSIKLPRKEVIHPQLPLRVPCYDFILVTSPTFVLHYLETFGHYRLP